MDELDVVGAMRPTVTIPEEARLAARRKLDGASADAPGERRSIGRRAGALAAVAAVAALVFVGGTLWPFTHPRRKPGGFRIRARLRRRFEAHRA